MNYFELFDLPFAPVIDKTFVARKFFELQKKYHPDFYSHASSDEQEKVLLQSANINDAFKIFQQPDKTLAYYLREKGILEEEEKFSLPPDFLMEMMELNEDLPDEEEVTTKAKINEYSTRLEKSVSSIYNNASIRELSMEELQALKTYYYKKKYLNRILDRLND